MKFIAKAINRLRQSLKHKSKVHIGRAAENYAAEFLNKEGFRTVEKNFIARGGEIDLICSKNSKVYFFEVRYRSSKSFGSAGESVSSLKIYRLYRAISQWILQRGLQSEFIGGVYAICIDMPAGRAEPVVKLVSLRV